jgi:hypothetical protein
MTYTKTPEVAQPKPLVVQSKMAGLPVMDQLFLAHLQKLGVTPMRQRQPEGDAVFLSNPRGVTSENGDPVVVFVGPSVDASKALSALGLYIHMGLDRKIKVGDAAPVLAVHPGCFTPGQQRLLETLSFEEEHHMSLPLDEDTSILANMRLIKPMGRAKGNEEQALDRDFLVWASRRGRPDFWPLRCHSGR